MITVFTPTYNRAYLLPKLYKSLCNQTFNDFEWIVIDDGSQDNTIELLKEWEQEARIHLIHDEQPNGGKHRAINKGVNIAHGELFFIVDSDDQLPPDSLEKINIQLQYIKDDPSFAGICGIKAYFDGSEVGGKSFFDIIECNSLDFRYKYQVSGDMAEVFRTEILKEFPFPEIAGEKFCPEALVWNRIATKYKIRYFHENVYLCDYLPDGLTAKIVKIRMQSPIASCLCYSELSAMQIPIKYKIKAAINYWRFFFCHSPHHKPKISIFWTFMAPIGLLMHLKDIKLQH